MRYANVEQMFGVNNNGKSFCLIMMQVGEIDDCIGDKYRVGRVHRWQQLT